MKSHPAWQKQLFFFLPAFNSKPLGVDGAGTGGECSSKVAAENITTLFGREVHPFRMIHLVSAAVEECLPKTAAFTAFLQRPNGCTFSRLAKQTKLMHPGALRRPGCAHLFLVNYGGARRSGVPEQQGTAAQHKVVFIIFLNKCARRWTRYRSTIKQFDSVVLRFGQKGTRGLCFLLKRWNTSQHNVTEALISYTDAAFCFLYRSRDH